MNAHQFKSGTDGRVILNSSQSGIIVMRQTLVIYSYDYGEMKRILTSIRRNMVAIASF